MTTNEQRPEGGTGAERAPRALPTIHDVARTAGVATSTVSRSLSGESRVSDQTRERVRRIADELGYRPNRSARALRSSTTGTIGLLAPNLENPIAYDHLRATIRAAHDLGYTVLVADGQDSAEIQDAELARMLDYRVDGLVIGRGILPITHRLRDVVNLSIPVEPAFHPGDLESPLGTRINVYRNLTSDAVGATIGYRRLVRLGHRRFAIFVFAYSISRLARARNELLEEVLLSEGVAPGDIVTVPISDPEECNTALQTLMASRDAPTAIISANGRLTPYVLEGIQSAGLQIPLDVSLLCFGDSQWHRGYAPPLAVIREDYAVVARQVVERLVARIEGRERPQDTPRPSEFVMRASLGLAPERRAGRLLRLRSK